MKRIVNLVVLLSCLMLVGCSISKTSPRSYLQAFVDFRPYLQDGFRIYTTPYAGKCIALGELSIYVTPERKEIRYDDTAMYDAVVEDWYGTSYGYEFIDTSELLADVVKRAKELGANGLSNLEISKVYNGTIPQYTISATCIIIEE